MLSFICPSIRLDNLPKMYESINKSFLGEWELIVISPYEEVKLGNNVKWIIDHGSPLRCQQIGLCHASGDYITRVVDDGVYLGQSLNTSFGLIDKNDYKSVVCLKFIEGEESRHKMYEDDFYNLSYHNQALRPYVPFHHKLLNFAIYSKQILNEVGGWDAGRFESIALGELDLSIRLQWYGANIVMTRGIVIKCEWEPGETGTHAPVHHSCSADQLIFNRIYDSPECENRVKIDIDNWKASPIRWDRRFKNV